MFRDLQSESEKAQGQLNVLQGKLAEMESSRSETERQLREVSVENGRLKMDLAAFKQKGTWDMKGVAP